MIGMYKTALPKDVEAEMRQLLDWYHKQEKTMKTLAEFHARYESIHPFQDGNGRTGRMILFRESLKYDELKPFIILDDDRSKYLEGLKEYREHHKVDQLLELMQKKLKHIIRNVNILFHRFRSEMVEGCWYIGVYQHGRENCNNTK